jgi:hypothetical protein
VEDPVTKQLLSIISAAHNNATFPAISCSGEDNVLLRKVFLNLATPCEPDFAGSGEDGFVYTFYRFKKPCSNFAWLGFSKYLADNARWKNHRDTFFLNSLRLGEFRNNPRSAEPFVCAMPLFIL